MGVQRPLPRLRVAEADAAARGLVRGLETVEDLCFRTRKDLALAIVEHGLEHAHGNRPARRDRLQLRRALGRQRVDVDDDGEQVETEAAGGRVRRERGAEGEGAADGARGRAHVHEVGARRDLLAGRVDRLRGGDGAGDGAEREHGGLRGGRERRLRRDAHRHGARGRVQAQHVVERPVAVDAAGRRAHLDDARVERPRVLGGDEGVVRVRERGALLLDGCRGADVAHDGGDLRVVCDVQGEVV